jgi:osmotically-inducible protein OsmY
MIADMDIQRDLKAELQWDPSIDDSSIQVTVEKGVVTLTGDVHHGSQSRAVEDIAKRIRGVRAIANDLQVKIPLMGERSDSAVAIAAAHALQWDIVTGNLKVQSVVNEGWVTLSGHVHWRFEKSAAEIVVKNLIGVRGVINEVVVMASNSLSDAKRKIECAFKRHGVLDSKDILVKVENATVTLSGNVRTWQDLEDAEAAASAAPGVAFVDNRLTVQ